MSTSTTGLNQVHHESEYHAYLNTVQQRFKEIVKSGHRLYTTDVSNLFDSIVNAKLRSNYLWRWARGCHCVWYRNE